MGDLKRSPAASDGRALILSSSAIGRCWHGTCSSSIHSHRRTAYASTSMAGIQGPACVGGSTFPFCNRSSARAEASPSGRAGPVQQRHPRSDFTTGTRILPGSPQADMARSDRATAVSGRASRPRFSDGSRSQQWSRRVCCARLGRLRVPLVAGKRLAPGGRRNRGYPRGPCAGRQ